MKNKNNLLWNSVIEEWNEQSWNIVDEECNETNDQTYYR